MDAGRSERFRWVAATKYTSSAKLNFQVTHAKNDLAVKSEEKYFVVWYKNTANKDLMKRNFHIFVVDFQNMINLKLLKVFTHSTCIETNCSILWTETQNRVFQLWNGKDNYTQKHKSWRLIFLNLSKFEATVAAILKMVICHGLAWKNQHNIYLQQDILVKLWGNQIVNHQILLNA